MSTPKIDKEKAKGEKFMNKAERERCWNARDQFWNCYRVGILSTLINLALPYSTQHPSLLYTI